MTAPVSATTARMRAFQVECQEIGKSMIGDYLTADGQLITLPETIDKVITILEYSLAISKECLAWRDSGGGYAEWLELYVRANNNEAYMNIDKTGRLKEIAAEMIQMTDLEEFFELDIKPLDLSQIDLAIEAQEWVLRKLKAGELS